MGENFRDIGVALIKVPFEEALQGMIKRNCLEKDAEKITASSYLPIKKTALPLLLEKIKKGGSDEKLMQEYQFLRSWSLVWYRQFGKEWIQDIKKAAALDTPFDYYSLKELVNLLKPNKDEKKRLELAPYLIFFKDYRDDVRRTHAFSWLFLFETIAKKFSVTTADVGYLTLDEIGEALVSGRLDKGIIKTRKEGQSVITISKAGDKIVVSSGLPSFYRQIINKINQDEKRFVVSGLVAQTGKARGKVRIVRSPHDLKHIEKGDIIVANTTHPDYLPAMQRAAAFVTNEGGVISHAAIIAREMKKPCIVGTKIATQVLQNGQLVEVDADKGVVRILK